MFRVINKDIKNIPWAHGITFRLLIVLCVLNLLYVMKLSFLYITWHHLPLNILDFSHFKICTFCTTTQIKKYPPISIQFLPFSFYLQDQDAKFLANIFVFWFVLWDSNLDQPSQVIVFNKIWSFNRFLVRYSNLQAPFSHHHGNPKYWFLITSIFHSHVYFNISYWLLNTF